MFWIFKLMAQFAVIILATVSLSNADLQEFFATRLKGKTVATSYLTLKRLSQVRCAEKCYNEGRCRIAGYNKVTKVCRLSNDSQQDVLDIADDSSSVFIYQQGIFTMRVYIFIWLLECVYLLFLHKLHLFIDIVIKGTMSIFCDQID